MRYAVTLTAEMNITAEDEDEARRHCDSDVREFFSVNLALGVKAVREVDPGRHPVTAELSEVVFREPEVVEAPSDGSVDWTMNGVYTVFVDGEDPEAAASAARALPGRFADVAAAAASGSKRYAVTLSAEMGITADDEDEAVRRCNDDAREFFFANDTLEVEGVVEVDPAQYGLTESVDDVAFEESEVVEAAEDGGEDWTMKGVYTLVVDAESREAAVAAARALPKLLEGKENSPAPGA